MDEGHAYITAEPRNCRRSATTSSSRRPVHGRIGEGDEGVATRWNKARLGSARARSDVCSHGSSVSAAQCGSMRVPLFTLSGT